MAADQQRAEQISTDLVHVMKTLGALRQQVTTGPAGADKAAYPVLLTLAEEPMRVSAVAERICSDVSTISRHVTTLVDKGLLERLPDDADRRAHLVGLTPLGQAAVDEVRTRRTAWMQGLLHDWDPADVDALSTTLRRLLLALQTQHQQLTPSTTPVKEPL